MRAKSIVNIGLWASRLDVKLRLFASLYFGPGMTGFCWAVSCYLYHQFCNQQRFQADGMLFTNLHKAQLAGGKSKATSHKFSTMPDKSEKERRKQIMDDLKKKADQEFENSLPMSRDIFKKLFGFLNVHIPDKDCDNTNSLTKTFLMQSGNQNVDEVLGWLADHGGYCDCEILANVEDQFE